MHWSDWQWAIYEFNQYVTAAAYLIIPAAMILMRLISRVHDMQVILLSHMQSKMFQWFIFLCGMHHLTHPEFMERNWFWPIVAVDFPMALVSIITAIQVSASASNSINIR